jgi:hypothetical protein
MAQATLVEKQINDGLRLIHRLAEKDIAVAAAGWVKEIESGQWFLYLATSLVGEDGATRPAYRRVNNVIREMQKNGFWIDPLEIKVIGPRDPIAKDMLAQRGAYYASFPARFNGSRLGDLAVDEAYIYPPTADKPRIFVFEYRRKGQTNHWVAVSPDKCIPCAAEDRWADGDVRVEQEEDRVIIKVYSEEALLEGDPALAEELAEDEFKKRFPGHRIDRPVENA